MKPPFLPGRVALAALGSALTLTTPGSCQGYDYVIAGAGTCGLLLANRLSADPDVTVALIEPGGDVRGNPNVTVITQWLSNQGSSIDWQYTSAPQANAGNQSLVYAAGKAIGGTSTINGKCLRVEYERQENQMDREQKEAKP